MSELSESKKKQIESLSTDEIAYEINLGRLSRFQRKKFAYLKTCYELRKAEIESVRIKDISAAPTTNKAKAIHYLNKKPIGKIINWHENPLGKIAIGIIITVLSLAVVLIINHYFNIKL